MREQYFVTLGVMTEETIPPGHGFLAISRFKHNGNKKQKVELLNGFSFYSENFSFANILRPCGPGHVICERLKWMVNIKGLTQMTVPVTPDQLAQILHKVNTDRRDFSHSYPNPDGTFKPGGPYFNLFTKQNCKEYCAQAIGASGIDVSALDSFMGIPRMMYNMQPMYVSCKHKDIVQNIDAKTRASRGFQIEHQHGPFYWDTPLNILLDNQPKTKDTPIYKRWNQFAEIRNATIAIQQRVEKRQRELLQHGKKVKEVDEINVKLIRLIARMKRIQCYPNQLTLECNHKMLQGLRNAVVPQVRSLQRKDKEWTLVNVITHIFEELLSSLKSLVFKPTGVTEHQGNFIDMHILNEIKGDIRRKSMRFYQNS